MDLLTIWAHPVSKSPDHFQAAEHHINILPKPVFRIVLMLKQSVSEYLAQLQAH
jgi:hypothetical protein